MDMKKNSKNQINKRDKSWTQRIKTYINSLKDQV